MKMYKPLFLLLLIGSFARPCFAQTDSEYDTTFNNIILNEPTDTSSSGFAAEVLGDTLINFRDLELRPDSMQGLKNKKSYAWIKSMDSLLRDMEKKSNDERSTYKAPPMPSFFERFFGSTFLQVILWLLAGLAVSYIIYQLFLNKGAFSSSTRRRKKHEIEDEEDDTDIRDKDYASRARRAEEAGDYRRATRFLFLQTLQKLQDTQLIVYSVDKTNSAYLREMPYAKRNDFSRLSLYYEYIWYGNAAVSKEIFDTVQAKFNSFLNTI